MARSFVNDEPKWLKQPGDPTQFMQFAGISLHFSSGDSRKKQIEEATAIFGPLLQIMQIIGKDEIPIEGLEGLIKTTNEKIT